MEKFICVFRVRTGEGKHRYGYSWLKKQSRAKALAAAEKSLDKDEALVNIWSCDWRQDPPKYTAQLGDIKEPEKDFLPLIRGNARWRQRGATWSARKKEPEKTTYVPRAYTLKIAEPK